MAISGTAAVREGLAGLFGAGTASGLDEARLIERFVASRDASAFEAIVARHGPMVWGVCRRSLRDPNDAEDAFQATFLIFARRAGAIRDPGRLGGWLHGVAVRVAVRARREAALRPSAKAEGLAEGGPGVGDDLERSERAELLHGEIERLPDRYRQPIVLCHLEGCTHEEAADRLGWPVGTVRGRLSRGRDRLRDGLARRGMASLAFPALVPQVPPALAGITATAASATAAGSGAAGMLGASRALVRIETLSRSLSMFEWKAVALKTVGVLTLATGGVATLAWEMVPRPAGPGPVAPASPAPAEPAKTYTDDRYGFSVAVPEPWAEARLGTFTVPGVIRAAWTGPGEASVVAFVQDVGQSFKARFLLDESVKSMKDVLKCQVHAAEVKSVAGKDAMWMVVSGKGTGGALDGKGDVDTTAHWVAVPRDQDVVILLMTCPSADYEARLPSFLAAVKSLKLDANQAPAVAVAAEPEKATLSPPADWGGGGTGYQLGRDEAVKHSGKSSGSVRSTATPGMFGTLTQGFQATAYRGKRLRLSAWARADGVERSAGLWMRVDGKARTTLAFDNMGARPIRGTADWKKYNVVLDIPDEAEEIYFGFLMSGKGRAWVDDIGFDVVGKDVASTAMEVEPQPRDGVFTPGLPAEPKNLGFER